MTRPVLPLPLRLGIKAGEVIALDQLTKWWARSRGWVSLNDGISGGVADGWGTGLSVLGLIIVGYLGWRVSNDRQRVWLSLVVAGGISNLIDRLIWGGVQDWLPVPILGLHNNLADYAIVGGLLGWLYTRWQERHAA